MQCILSQYVAHTVKVIVFGFGTLQAFCSVQVSLILKGVELQRSFQI